MKDSLNRRSLLKNTAGLLALSALPAALLKASSRNGKRICLGGPIFLDSDGPGALALEHRRLGYRAAYVPKVERHEEDRIRAIVKEFAARDVVIAEVGAWVNMLDPDGEKRRKNLEYVEQRLALAEEVGARCCVNIAGSYDTRVWYAPNPKNFSKEFMEATVENCRRLIDAVKPTRTKFSRDDALLFPERARRVSEAPEGGGSESICGSPRCLQRDQQSPTDVQH